MNIPIFFSFGEEAKSDVNDSETGSTVPLSSEWNPIVDDFPFLKSSLEELGIDSEDWLNQASKWRDEDWQGLDRPNGLLYATHRLQTECKELTKNKADLGTELETQIMQSCLEELSNLVFPEYASEIILLSRRLKEYNSWKDNQYSEISEETMWNKRTQIFGRKYVEEVYAQELDLYQMKKSLDALMLAPDKVEDKWQKYENKIDQKNLSSEEKIEYIELFLASKEIQEELRNSQPEQRSALLRSIRNSVNLPEERMFELESLDSKRFQENSQDPQTFFLQ
jgi:hypothetical protein